MIDEVLKFLNNKIQNDLEVLCIKDMTAFIIQTSTIYAKHSLIMTTQSKWNVVLQFGQEFRGKFAEAFELGLLMPWNEETS